jgi:NAD(P)-dependent dehydrogenase (short-subunit alcohol dehydrogenase family)
MSVSDPGLLAGRRALVTGAASGMGAETARRFVAQGARVALLDKDPAVKTVAEEIGMPHHVCDVTDLEQVETSWEAVAEEFGGLDTVVNNAGFGTASKIHRTAPELWRSLIDVNLTGVWHGIRAAAPLLRASGGGVIVNTASISGVRPASGEAGYAAAKAGVIALTATAALEYAPEIRVNAVSPGTIRTTLTAPMLAWDVMAEAQVRKIPLGRIGEPDDVADVIVFLCSDLARFMTGQNLVVDGGNTLHGSGVDGLLDLLASHGLEVD